MLIVDDDVRNIFALTSVLERHEMKVVLRRERPRRASRCCRSTPDIDVVLMDIMMPEMDGYETMRAIRAHAASSRSLPIIALTAKAMKGDREKCIEAGASDYITKPVDTEQLLSLLRVWLYGAWRPQSAMADAWPSSADSPTPLRNGAGRAERPAPDRAQTTAAR